MSCRDCTDPDGSPCFPVYGLAPHVHTKDAHIFDLSPTPGFTPDPEEPTHGVWWCPRCGDGMPQEELDRLLAAVADEPDVKNASENGSAMMEKLVRILHDLSTEKDE